jgi:hypothetical protein
MNHFSHTQKDRGRSSVSTLKYSFRLERCVNLFLHTEHDKVRSSMCTLRWAFRLER